MRVIAIDGPAASGKSSTGARVAERLGWAHLDSGALYRAMTLAALDNLGEEGGGKGDVEEAVRSERVTARVSAVAALPEVRAWVNAEQRRAVARHPAGVVVDGRDIGTVVFPDAPLKIFLTATPEERARRRLTQRGQAPDAERLRRESQALAARDDADRERPVAPLKPAPDAVLLDTTHVSLDEQVARVVTLARERFPG